MLHGFLGSSGDMLEMAESLSGEFHCIIPDLPGHGKSLFKNGKLSGLNSFISLSQMISGLLLSRGIKNYSLYGYSMGGRVAAGMAVLYPERIESLILESSSFGIEDQGEREMRYKKDLTLLEGVTRESGFREFLEKWYKLELFKTLDKGLIESLVKTRSGNDPGELRKAMRIMSTGNQPCFINGLAKGKLNIGYIYGTEDIKYCEEAESAKRKIPGMELFPVKEASHNVHLQFPEEVLSIIRNSAIF